MAIIECDSLSLGYGGREVIGGLSFKVETGDYLCIVGENGAGKTTLMKTLLALQKPLGGNLTFGEGFDRKKIGYLPQQTLVQRDFPAVVEEIVRSGCLNRLRHRVFFGSKENERTKNALETLGILELRKKSYRELSGGQQQRVLLARALCAADSTLLLDEPVTGLDMEATADLYGIIKNLHARGMTILMITHDEDAVQYATHVLHLGKTFFFGTKSEFEKTNLGKKELNR